jgi:hypothetical protein
LTLIKETSRWNVVITQGTRPCPRRAHTAVYYEKESSLYVFGGGDGIHALNDLYRLCITFKKDEDEINAEWSCVNTVGEIPLPRGYHTSNLLKNKLYIYGGADGKELFSDVCVLDLDTYVWKCIKQPESTTEEGKICRRSHTSTQVGNYLFVIGGHNGSHYNSEVLLFNIATLQWESKLIKTPKSFTARGYHTAVYHDYRIFLVGGLSGDTVSSDMWVLDLASYAYIPMLEFAKPVVKTNLKNTFSMEILKNEDKSKLREDRSIHPNPPISNIMDGK